MSKKKQVSFMTKTVVICLSFTAAMIIACYVGRWYGIDTSHELTITSVVFGGEMILLIVKKLIDDQRGGKVHD